MHAPMQLETGRAPSTLSIVRGSWHAGSNPTPFPLPSSKIYLIFGQHLNGYRPNSAPHAAHCKSRNGGEETCYDRMFALPAEKNQGQRHLDA